jgi:hypothetical protein
MPQGAASAEPQDPAPPGRAPDPAPPGGSVARTQPRLLDAKIQRRKPEATARRSLSLTRHRRISSKHLPPGPDGDDKRATVRGRIDHVVSLTSTTYGMLDIHPKHEAAAATVVAAASSKEKEQPLPPVQEKPISKETVKCDACNENGLVRCQICS